MKFQTVPARHFAAGVCPYRPPDARANNQVLRRRGSVTLVHHVSPNYTRMELHDPAAVKPAKEKVSEIAERLRREGGGLISIFYHLRWVTRAVTQFFDVELRRQGIRPTQTPTLGALNAKGSLGMAELSDWLGMERTTLVRNLRPLERDGLLQITGGRGGKVSLTIIDKGRKALTKALPAWHAAQTEVVETLGKKRWSAILNDLEAAALKLGK